MKNISCILLIFWITGCIKKNPEPISTELPPITSTGENTLGCRINGEIFVAQFTAWTSPGAPAQATRILDFPTYPDYVLSFDGNRNTTSNSGVANGSVIFFLKNITDTGSYTLSPRMANISIKGKTYYTDSLRTGIITFTKLDTIKKIVSGTFYFNAISPDKTIISATDGRFDLKQ